MTDLSADERWLFSSWLCHRAPIDRLPLPATIAGTAGILISIVTMAISPGITVEMAIVIPAGLLLLIACVSDRRRRLHGEREWEKEVPEYVLRQISQTCSAATVRGLQVLKEAAPDQILRFQHLDQMMGGMGGRQCPWGNESCLRQRRAGGPSLPLYFRS